MLIRLLPLACLALLASCSTPSTVARFRGLDHESKDLFIAYYPELSHEQRQVALDDVMRIDSLLKHWKIKQRPEFKPEIAALEITPAQDSPILSGEAVKLKAVLKYRDGQTADATQDVEWEVKPDLAWMEENALNFDCLASDVTVTATFVGERSGTRTVAVRKPLKDLEVSIAGSSNSSDGGEFIRLETVAYCQDGTSAKVSCQSDWHLIESPGEIDSCGAIHLPERAIEGNQFTVKAEYGEKSVIKKIGAPGRRPAGREVFIRN